MRISAIVADGCLGQRGSRRSQAVSQRYCPTGDLGLRQDSDPSRPEFTADANRPGDDFNRRATWREILEPGGWKVARIRDQVVHWTRPGKDDGVSATSGYCESEKSGDLL